MKSAPMRHAPRRRCWPAGNWFQANSTRSLHGLLACAARGRNVISVSAGVYGCILLGAHFERFNIPALQGFRRLWARGCGCGENLGQQKFARTAVARDFFLSARRYASTVLAVARCLSVCLFVCHNSVVLSKRPDGSSRFLVWRLSSIYPTLCCKKIRVLGYLYTSGALRSFSSHCTDHFGGPKYGTGSGLVFWQ